MIAWSDYQVLISIGSEAERKKHMDTSTKTAKARKPKPVPTLIVPLTLTAGVIDEDATRASFETQLANLKADTSTSREVILGAVNAVFDAYRGQAIKLPVLSSMAMGHIHAPPASHPAVEERVKDFVRQNAVARKDWTPESTALFTLGKGAGGGCKRVSDFPADVAVAVTDDDDSE